MITRKISHGFVINLHFLVLKMSAQKFRVDGLMMMSKRCLIFLSCFFTLTLEIILSDKINESAKLRSQNALLPYVARAPRVLVLHVLPCPMCLMLYMLLRLTCLVLPLLLCPKCLVPHESHVLRALHGFVLYVLVSYLLLWLTCIVPHVLSCLMCLVP